MRITVVIHRENGHSSRIDTAVSLINGCQRFYHLAVQRISEFERSDRRVSAEELSQWLEATFPGQHTIMIVEDRLEDNWFSHEYRSSAVVTTSDWEQKYAPPSLRAYLIYQIAQALVHFSADMSEEMALNMVHEPPVGCIYDMAAHKPDIKLGMVAGNLCPYCAAKLRALGTDERAIEAAIKIVNLVMAEALGRPLVLDPKEIFVVMRFTQNDENDNAWRYGIKVGVEGCGFRAVRADTRVESTQILDKINTAIQRSRLVIAKIDENNLNVYYELGYSMGLGKDVLLISSSDLVVNLPTDLKNWECLTYDKGDYGQLAEKVRCYLTEQYAFS